MATSLPSVASFWFGPKLGLTEVLCLKSFLALGHEVVLYTFGDVKNLPDGVKAEDASSLICAHEAEKYSTGGVIPALSDRFRYLMLNRTDHIWVDTDMLAIQPMPYQDHLFGRFKNQTHLINNAVLRLPKNSDTLLGLIEMTDDFCPMIPEDWRYGKKFFAHLNPTGAAIDLPSNQFSAADLPFYTCGPHALTYWLKKTNKMRLAQKPDVFYPEDARIIARNSKKPDKFPLELSDNTIAVHHVGGGIFRRYVSDDAGVLQIHPDSLVGQACSQLDVTPSDY